MQQLNQLNIKTMAHKGSYYISFANKYYTLWYVDVYHIVDIDRGYEYDDVRATYIKNISMDKDVTLAKYPDTPWNTELQGKSRSFTYITNKVRIDNHCFSYGKYRGMKFEECTDYNYMVWYFNNQSWEDRHEISNNIKPLVDIVEANTDYILYMYDNGVYDFITPEEYEGILENKKHNDIIASTFNDGYAIVDVLSNWLDSHDGYYRLNADCDYNFLFAEENTIYYNGNYYSDGGYKPALKGKGKNLKNKTVKLYIHKLTTKKNSYIVDGFEILK